MEVLDFEHQFPAVFWSFLAFLLIFDQDNQAQDHLDAVRRSNKSFGCFKFGTTAFGPMSFWARDILDKVVWSKVLYAKFIWDNGI